MLLQMRREMHTFVLSKLQTMMHTIMPTLPPTFVRSQMLRAVLSVMHTFMLSGLQTIMQSVMPNMPPTTMPIIVPPVIAQVHDNSGAHTILCGFESGRLTP